MGVGPEPGRSKHDRPRGVPAGTGHAATPLALSFIRTVTVGPGIAPGLLTLRPACTGPRRSRAPAACTTDTAGGEFHPAPRTSGNDASTRTYHPGFPKSPSAKPLVVSRPVTVSSRPGTVFPGLSRHSRRCPGLVSWCPPAPMAGDPRPRAIHRTAIHCHKESQWPETPMLIRPARSRRRLAVGLFVQCLMLVVDHRRLRGAEGGNHALGNGRADAPGTGGEKGRGRRRRRPPRRPSSRPRTRSC